MSFIDFVNLFYTNIFGMSRADFLVYIRDGLVSGSDGSLNIFYDFMSNVIGNLPILIIVALLILILFIIFRFFAKLFKF